VNPEKLKQLFDLVRTAAQKAGRNPANIEFSCMASSTRLDNLKALEDLGISRVVSGPPRPNPEAITRTLEKFQEEVVARI
jgi:hypothetical protein